MNKKTFIISLILIALFPILNADSVSINAGGSDNIIISSTPYVGGFFTTDTSSGGAVESFVEEPEPTPTTSEDTSASTGGTGGGGTVSNTYVRSGNLVVLPAELSLSVIENVEETREVLIKNTGNAQITITISVVGEEIENVLTISEEKVTLKPNEQQILILTVSKLNGKQLLAGNILMKYSGITKKVPIVIGSKSSNFLFDASVSLSNKFKKILPGTRLSAQFDLIQISSSEKVDVVANYIIKDFEGNKYYEEGETFFVSGEKDYIKEFPTENLEEGKYVLGFELVYPGAFAVSSTTFDIERQRLGFNTTTMIIILSIAAIFIMALFWKIVKRKKPRSHKRR
jgi:hypothetical protein